MITDDIFPRMGNKQIQPEIQHRKIRMKVQKIHSKITVDNMEHYMDSNGAQQ